MCFRLYSNLFFNCFIKFKDVEVLGFFLIMEGLFVSLVVLSFFLGCLVVVYGLFIVLEIWSECCDRELLVV